MKFTLSAACLIALGAALPASAQVNTLDADNPRENARLHFGPFHVTPSLTLTELGIDSNVFNEKKERRSDFTLTLTPSATVWVPIARRGLIKTNVATDAVYYRRFKGERAVNSNVSGRGEAYLRRVTLFADAGVLYSRQRPNDEIDVRSRRVERLLSGGFDARVTPKTAFGVSMSRSSLSYDDDAAFLGVTLSETLDQKTTDVTAVAGYRYSGLTTFAVRASRFETRFDRTPDRDNDNVRVMVGAEFEPRALIKGEAYLGVRHLNPLDETKMPEFAGLVSDLTLQYILVGATTFEVRHLRDVVYSFEPAYPYYLSNSATVGLRRALGPLFDLEVTAGRSSLAYRDVLETGDDRTDFVYSYGGSVGLRLGRHGRLGVGAVYTTRESILPDREYAGLRIRTTANYGF